jgi:hypothetical protein
VYVVAFIEKACVRAVIAPQLLYRRANVVNAVAAQVAAVRNTAD